MAITIHDVEQRSPEWFALRKGKVTGSNSHILLTNGLEQALQTNTSNTGFSNYWATRGKLLEKDAIELYEKLYDIDVLVPGFVTNTDYPNAGASPDGIAGNIILVEVKAFKDEKHNSITEDNIPFTVMAQLQFNMLICELETSDLVLYNPDLSIDKAFKKISVPKNTPIASNIINKLRGK